MGKKKLRHQRIRNLIQSQVISSQHVLLRELTKKGLKISQATLSRDLNELGVVKIRTKNGQYRYVETKESESLTVQTWLEKELLAFLNEYVTVGNLVVLKTSSGNASGVAKSLDEVHWPEVVGTVAGDDTILVITRTKKDAANVMKKIKLIAG